MTSKFCAATLVALLPSFALACKGGDKKPTPAPTGAGSSAGTASAAGKAPTKAPARGPERAVYSLIDNRLAAHLHRNGGLVLAGGSAGFAKYTRFGNTEKIKTPAWQLRQTQDQSKVAIMSGASARLDVPVTAAELAGEPVIRVRVYSAAPRAFSVRVNGNKDVNGQAAEGWTVIELKPPTGQFKEGENELLFFTRGPGLAVDWVQVGGAAPAEATATRFYDPATKSLVLPDGGGLAYYVQVPEGGRVTGDLADGACEVTVKATAADGAGADGKLTGLGSAVDLAALGGKAVRLELTAAGCPEAKLANAALVVAGTEPTPARGAAPKYVVMFVMDSLRADRVRVFSPGARPEVPTWEKLAETSAVFMQHYVQGNESRVSHASLWSSLYPIKHSMIGASEKLDPKWTTIDEVAKTGGKFVAGASANGYVDPKRWGFGTAWDAYSNHIHEALGLKAEDILAKGLKFVGARKEPWFLYLGTVDTHVSWRAKEPWLAKYDPGYSGRFKDVFSGADAAAAASGGKLTEAETRHVRALYDSNVSYQDKVLGDLIAALQTAGVWNETMLIITADHGDEQWEDGRVGHGASSRDMLVHVPLLIHYPPMFPAGKHAEGTELIDVVPTVADALGVQTDPEWQGQSLVPLANGVGAGYGRLSLSSMYEDSHGARLGDWKVRISGGANLRVYDLAADPDEMKSLTGDAAAAIGGRTVLDPLWLLRTFNKDWKKSVWGNAANVSARFAEDMGE
ncbi:MAG: sulfatase [Myxococcales bacterium]|nr:sulfatase [Myxococcales bacterium]